MKIEKKKNQLFYDIQSMKFMSENSLHIDPFELRAKVEEKQK